LVFPKLKIKMKTELLFDLATASPHETEAAGVRVADLLKTEINPSKDYPVVALYGDLGAGKTVFVRGMASLLSPDAHVKSPTYTIVNEYEGDIPLYHFDMYRIESEDDLYSIGFDDYLERGVAVIEWSENIPYALPKEYIRVTIDKVSDTERHIKAEKVNG